MSNEAEIEGGPFQEGHPDRPNSGESDAEATVTEEALAGAERRQRAYGPRGAVGQGPMTDVTIADLETKEDLEQQLQDLEDQVGDNRTNPNRIAELIGERENLQNRIKRLEMDERDEETFSGEAQARTSVNTVDDEARAGSRGQDRAAEVQARNDERKAGKRAGKSKDEGSSSTLP